MRSVSQKYWMNWPHACRFLQSCTQWKKRVVLLVLSKKLLASAKNVAANSYFWYFQN